MISSTQLCWRYHSLPLKQQIIEAVLCCRSGFWSPPVWYEGHCHQTWWRSAGHLPGSSLRPHQSHRPVYFHPHKSCAADWWLLSRCAWWIWYRWGWHMTYLIEAEWCIYALVNWTSLVQIKGWHLFGAKPLSEPPGTNFDEILIDTHTFKKMRWKMAAILSRPQCV